MATTPEGRVKTAIKTYLKTLSHCWFFMPQGNGYGVNGVPDIVGCYCGVFFAVEVKAPGKLRTLTAMQRIQIAAIGRAYGYVIAADTVGAVQDLIESIDRTLAVTKMMEQGA